MYIGNVILLVIRKQSNHFKLINNSDKLLCIDIFIPKMLRSQTVFNQFLIIPNDSEFIILTASIQNNKCEL